jgi:hypothetical protein
VPGGVAIPGGSGTLLGHGQWLLIDGTMDNEVSTEAENGDPRGVVDLGNSIRRAGWDQNPGWPQDRRGFDTWRAPGQRR